MSASATRDDWLAAVAKALKSDPDAALDRLRSTTYDGIVIEPLYTADDALEPAAVVRGSRRGGWDVRQLVDAAAGPGRAVDELERGATSILLDLTGLAEITADGVQRRTRRCPARRGARRPPRRDALARGRRRVHAAGRHARARRRPDRRGSRAPVGVRSRRAPHRPRRLVRPQREPSPDHRRCDAVPRRRRVRRRAARLRDRRARRLPPRARRARRRSRHGVAPVGAAPRRHRRPVRHDRLDPRRPPAVRPRRRGRRRAGWGPARARGHLAGDDDPLRPVGERPAFDGRLLRCRRRRRRRRHRPPPRRPARCGRARPARRPQHAVDPRRRVAPRRGRRPGGRFVVRRALHRPARRGGVELVPGDRTGRRVPPRRRRRSRRRAHRRDRCGAPARHRHAQGAADRPQRVPQRRRGDAATRARAGERRRPRPPSLGGGIRGAARPGRPGDHVAGFAAVGVPGHDRTGRRIHAARRVRREPLRHRRPGMHPRGGSGLRCVGMRRSPASARATPSTPNMPPTSPPSSTRPGRRPSTSPASRRPASTGRSTPASTHGSRSARCST